jgi:hypothetical protein
MCGVGSVHSKEVLTISVRGLQRDPLRLLPVNARLMPKL